MYDQGGKKRILLFMPNFCHGGAEGVMVQVANHLSELQFDVSIAVADKSGPLVERLNQNINVIDFAVRNYWFSFFGLFQILRAGKFDVIFSTIKECNLISILATKLSLSSAKVVVREANTVSQQLEYEVKLHQKIKNWLILKLYKFSDTVIVLSKSMRDDLLICVPGLDREKIRIIPNPIDFDGVSRLSLEPVEDDENRFFREGRPTFICVGRIFPQKNYFFLIRALHKYKLLGYDFDLLIVGDGIERQKLEAEIVRLGLVDNCHLLGYKSNPFKYMKLSDAFILPSKYEGMSNSLIQACYLNVPSLVADNQKTSLEVQQHVNMGYSYKKNDIDDFISSLNSLLSRSKKITPFFSTSMFGTSLDKYLEVLSN